MGKIGIRKRDWFFRGLAAGFIVVAAANAVSYFLLSDGWTDLIGATSNQVEAVGFPFEMWRENTFYGGWIVDRPKVHWNAAAALLAGSLIGIGFVQSRSIFNRWIAEYEAGDASVLNRPLKLQFSMKGLLVSVIVISVIAAAINAWGACPEVLGAIYFLGPLTLVILAMLPSKISWQHRVVVLLIFAMAMLVAAVVAGTQMGMDFDRVLFGIFLCWTPQSTIAAVAVTCGLVWQRMRVDGAVRKSNVG